MSTTVWKGHIAFGLVSFPVKLHAAARSQSINFHQLHQCDQARVKQVLYCQAEDRPVPRARRACLDAPSLSFIDKIKHFTADRLYSDLPV